MKKALDFVQEIGTIMYVGGILSHIVIGAVMASDDAVTMSHIYQYKLMSAYILILPGLALKIVSDILLYMHFQIKPNWLKVKLLMTAILAINAFVFLVPMMPELLELAKASIPKGVVSQAFKDKEHAEALVGMSNVIPLLTEIIMGAFRPKLGRERRAG